MTSLHWFPFYWDEYSTKTMHLTQAQHGAFMLLLRWIYTTGNPVPDKQKYSIAQARLKPELDATDMVLSGFFEENCGFWHNLKAEQVMAQAAERHRANASKGRIGGLKRASNAQAGLQPKLNVGSSNYNNSKKEEVSKEEATSVALPVWLNLEAWQSFLEMRKKKRAPVTPRAVKSLLAKLDGWRLKGHDPTAIIDQSITNAWTDFYELKDLKNGRQKQSAHSKFAEGAYLAATEPEPGLENGGIGHPDAIGYPLLETRLRTEPD